MSSHTETPTQLPPLPADGLWWSKHPELDAGGLIIFAASRLAAFKVPSRVEVRAALPTNATGKIQAAAAGEVRLLGRGRLVSWS
jgi:acyl-CoA synthetase (AMP-forming)/AMP-acid ligase II